MGSFREEEGEEYRFFDAHEDIAPVSDSGSDSSSEIGNWVFSSNFSSNFEYDVWIHSPISVEERRNKFLSWMGVSSNRISIDRDFDRVMDSNEEHLSNYSTKFSKDLCMKDDFACKTGNSGRKTKFIVDKFGNSGNMIDCREMGFDQTVKNEELKGPPSKLESVDIGVKKGWLSKLLSMACIVDNQLEVDNLRPDESDSIRGSRVQRVRVRQSKKRSKELSALYLGQEIRAHEGSISTMKFSLDGQYLASAGDDGVVRLWQVVEDDRSNELDIPEIDPSCVYFTVNSPSELAPLCLDGEKMGTMKILRKTPDSACVIFPPKVFRILEKPLHEFRGHSGKILDLSWSKNNHLLSSSVDETVRLWRVGCDQCIKVFSHSNYVTCVQFNPVDDNYFISGSIDGKVRIWAISDCQVIDWTDIKEMVTAVCYQPNGQGGIVGCMTGICRFYIISDNHLQLDAQICLHSKKKSPCKRITGFEFFPQDSSKVMVTCADSHVRILHGINVIGKYKGLRKAGNQMFASLTSDGKHIVSACEDSNVYLWNCSNEEEPVSSHVKNVCSSERFSTNVSIAIPWSGLKNGTHESTSHFHTLDGNLSSALPFFSSETCPSLSQEMFLESFPKGGSATYPEEKLLTSNPNPVTSSIHKSQYKFLKTSCQSTSSSHAWGMVIVTAGYDGRIRSFHNYGLPVVL